MQNKNGNEVSSFFVQSLVFTVGPSAWALHVGPGQRAAQKTQQQKVIFSLWLDEPADIWQRGNGAHLVLPLWM
jgi:hypothetical protein